MKTREVIKIRQTMTLQELYDFMQLHWDRERYNDFIIGKPGAGAFTDYIMLPATARCAVCIYPRKDKVILAVMTNSNGQVALAGSLMLGGLGSMGMVAEINGLAVQVIGLYAAYLESLFAKAGLLSGDPKREQPVIPGQSDFAVGGKAGNVLELVKFAPQEARGISILSLVLGILSLVLFMTGIPGVLLGIAAIFIANSVLKNQGFQSQAFAGQFCGKIGLWMSAIVAFIVIVGNLLPRLNP